MFKLTKKLLVLLIVSVIMISFATATAYAVNTPIDDKNTGIIKIDSKEKTVGYKVTWNANGGKIGTKKIKVTTVKKNSKVGKLITPKRTGYTFKGWYSKKTGGKKIPKNTKVSKKVTYYAKWTKTTSAAASKIVGHWQYKQLEYSNGQSNMHWKNYYFHANGRFQYIDIDFGFGPFKKEGKYSVSNGKVYFKEIKFYRCSNGKVLENVVKFGDDHSKYQFDISFSEKHKDITAEYKLGLDKEGNYLKIFAHRDFFENNLPVLTLKGHNSDIFRKMP